MDCRHGSSAGYFNIVYRSRVQVGTCSAHDAAIATPIVCGLHAAGRRGKTNISHIAIYVHSSVESRCDPDARSISLWSLRSLRRRSSVCGDFDAQRIRRPVGVGLVKGRGRGRSRNRGPGHGHRSLARVLLVSARAVVVACGGGCSACKMAAMHPVQTRCGRGSGAVPHGSMLDVQCCSRGIFLAAVGVAPQHTLAGRPCFMCSIPVHCKVQWLLLLLLCGAALLLCEQLIVHSNKVSACRSRFQSKRRNVFWSVDR